ncbi:tail fiber assembly protein [Citrobacter koseri]|uniref:tail fiber assembly protein n=1 Tax=Citrobacter koseri TaxID=545 RepID=UPI0019043A07|nr:tail fiber assembly protein [Citrobacter koseri]MBJ9237125.1 tail fiber assembly protein [Citrobacter koseri]
MSNYVYSPSKNVFFLVSKQDEYKSAGSWPDDGVEVTDATFSEYTGRPPEGQQRVAGEDGQPVWGDLPAPTQEELIADADGEKQQLINEANDYMNSKQWPGKAAMGRLTDSEKAQYNAWLDYLDALEAVDTSSAPDIEWPTPPAQ